MLCKTINVKYPGCIQEYFYSLDCNIIPIFINNSLIDLRDLNNIKKIYIRNYLPNEFLKFLLNIVYFDIQDIFLSNNFTFPSLSNLIYLHIVNASLTASNSIFSIKLKKLQYLNISHNLINSIDFLNFYQCRHLYKFDISFTKINSFLIKHSKEIKNLKILKMINCKIDTISPQLFSKFQELNYLYLFGTKLPTKVLTNIAKNLKKLKLVVGNSFAICCLIWKYLSSYINCQPSSAAFHTCSTLISSNFKRAIYWSFGIIGFIGNVTSLWLTLKSLKSSKFFPLLLILGDLLTSLYVLFIAIADIYFLGNYLENDIHWRKSPFCQILGTSITFSLIISNIGMVLMTIERHQAVTNPFMKSFFFIHSKEIIPIAIAFAILVSFIPLLFNSVIILLIKYQ